ncbi:Lrp/AsnC family transcriptional regulator [Thalassobius sp. Cn5-15]|uniref:Lrp/AsnC family transcriptional regulator n=1 Tax=Thalassobius sp. Cn5-15 TaxID=2917763 RepID=UPI001EF3BCDB|nr:Lrp/AsnC family transcriptional regulator [Thalassobius sp. Cn5-15]MCG7494165.1 Lrp/AsnC family transcriptional regulator [Thalassobius sp. Cn5-15]
MTVLSQTDRKLIAALRDNARASVTELAHITGVSRTTVKTRLDALVAEGRITRFTIETDSDHHEQVRAITMVELQGSMSRTVVRTLRAIPEVTMIYSTNGAWDLVVEIRAETLPQFDRVLREIREVKGVTNSESSLLLSNVTV